MWLHCWPPLPNRSRWRRFTYQLKLLEQGLRALAAAAQTFVRVNDRGMLMLAHKLLTDAGSACYVTFTLMPDEPDDEDGGVFAVGRLDAGVAARGERDEQQQEDEDEAMGIGAPAGSSQATEASEASATMFELRKRQGLAAAGRSGPAGRSGTQQADDGGSNGRDARGRFDRYGVAGGAAEGAYDDDDRSYGGTGEGQNEPQAEVYDGAGSSYFNRGGADAGGYGGHGGTGAGGGDAYYDDDGGGAGFKPGHRGAGVGAGSAAGAARGHRY
jgi:hypothetical protein